MNQIGKKLKNLTSFGGSLLSAGAAQLSKLQIRGYQVQVKPLHLGLAAAGVAVAITAMVIYFFRKSPSKSTKVVRTSGTIPITPVPPQQQPQNPPNMPPQQPPEPQPRHWQAGRPEMQNPRFMKPAEHRIPIIPSQQELIQPSLEELAEQARAAFEASFVDELKEIKKNPQVDVLKARLDEVKAKGWANCVYEGVTVENHLTDLIVIATHKEDVLSLIGWSQSDDEMSVSPIAKVSDAAFYASESQARVALIASATERNVHKKLINFSVNLLKKNVQVKTSAIEELLATVLYTTQAYTQLREVAEQYKKPIIEEVDSVIEETVSFLEPLDQWLAQCKTKFDEDEARLTQFEKALNDFHSGEEDWMLMDIAINELQTANSEIKNEIDCLHGLLSAADLLSENPTQAKLNWASELLKNHRSVQLTSLLEELTMPVEKLLRKKMAEASLTIALTTVQDLVDDLKAKIENNDSDDEISTLDSQFDTLYATYTELAKDHFKDCLGLKEKLDECKTELSKREAKATFNVSVQWSPEPITQMVEVEENITDLLQNSGVGHLDQNIRNTALIKNRGKAEPQDLEEWDYTDDQGNVVQLKTRPFPEELASNYHVTFGQEKKGIDSRSVNADRDTWAGIVKNKLAGLNLQDPRLISGVLNNLWREKSLIEIGLKLRQTLNEGNNETIQLITHQKQTVHVNVQVEGGYLVVKQTVRHQLAVQDHEAGIVTVLSPIAEHTLKAKILIGNPDVVGLTWTPKPFGVPVPELEASPISALSFSPKTKIIEDYNPNDISDGIDIDKDFIVAPKRSLAETLKLMSYVELRDHKFALALEAVEGVFPDEKNVPETSLGNEVEALRAILKGDYSKHYERYSAFRTKLQNIFGMKEYQEARDARIAKKDHDQAVDILMGINYARYRNNKMKTYCEVLVDTALKAGYDHLAHSGKALPPLSENATPAERIAHGIACMKEAGKTAMGESKFEVEVSKFLSIWNSGFDPAAKTNVPFAWEDIEIDGKPRGWLRFGTPTKGAVVNPDMFAYLDVLAINEEEHIHFNLQNREAKSILSFEGLFGSPERNRSLSLEGLNSHKAGSAVTFAQDSEWYRQEGAFKEQSQSDRFILDFMGQMQAKDCGYHFPEKWTRRFGFWAEVKDVLKDVHQNMFGGRATLTREERLEFIEIAYVFLILKFLKDTGAISFVIACKDNIDRGGKLNSLLRFVIGLLNGEGDSPEFLKEHETMTHSPAFIAKTNGIISSRSPRLVGPLKTLWDNRELLANSFVLKALYLDSRMEVLEPTVNEIVENVFRYSIANASPFDKDGEGPSSVAVDLLTQIVKKTMEPRLQTRILEMGLKKLEQTFANTELLKVADEINGLAKAASAPLQEPYTEKHPPLNRKTLLVQQGKDYRSFNARNVAKRIHGHWDYYQSRTLEQWTDYLGSQQELLEKVKKQTDAGNVERLSMLRSFYQGLALQLTNLARVSVNDPTYEEFTEECPKFSKIEPKLEDFPLRLELPGIIESGEEFYFSSDNSSDSEVTDSYDSGINILEDDSGLIEDRQKRFEEALTKYQGKKTSWEAKVTEWEDKKAEWSQNKAEWEANMLPQWAELRNRFGVFSKKVITARKALLVRVKNFGKGEPDDLFDKSVQKLVDEYSDLLGNAMENPRRGFSIRCS